jgi:hypothetical protein
LEQDLQGVERQIEEHEKQVRTFDFERQFLLLLGSLTACTRLSDFQTFS